MRTLHAICTLLLLIGIGLFAFDLVYHWAVYGQVKVITVGHLWKGLSKTNFINASSYAETFIPAQTWDMFVQFPVQAVFLVIAAVLYLPLMIIQFFKKEED